MTTPVRIFVSYARKDLEHLEALETHLANFKRQNLIEVWSARKPSASLRRQPEVGPAQGARVVFRLTS